MKKNEIHNFIREKVKSGEWYSGSPSGKEIAVICHPRDDYKVRIDIWEHDYGFIDRIYENDQNPACAEILLLRTKWKATRKDSLAKLNITNPEPPDTLQELDDRLFEVDDKLTSKHRKSILEWCNRNDDPEEISNWKGIRSTWRKMHPNSEPPKNKKQPKNRRR